MHQDFSNTRQDFSNIYIIRLLNIHQDFSNIHYDFRITSQSRVRRKTLIDEYIFKQLFWHHAIVYNV